MEFIFRCLIVLVILPAVPFLATAFVLLWIAEKVLGLDVLAV